MTRNRFDIHYCIRCKKPLEGHRHYCIPCTKATDNLKQRKRNEAMYWTNHNGFRDKALENSKIQHQNQKGWKLKRRDS